MSSARATGKLTLESTRMVCIRVIAKRREIMKRWQPILVILVFTLSGCATSSEEFADESPGAT